MEIVIKIDENLYTRLFDNGTDFYDTDDILAMGKAIRNGTVLPKGHGRLGDLDALEKEIVNGIKAGLYEEGYEEYGHINDMDDCVECVKYAPTIIDRSEE